ncbi:MAG: hypothetical protein R3Y47_03015 [Lachnospiraceae bacterium]
MVTKMEGYFKQLEQALMDLPEEDRSEAILYYKDYVFDAEVTESTVEEVLGRPQELARNIRQELYASEHQTSGNKKVPIPYKSMEKEAYEKPQGKTKRKRTTLEIVLIILLLVITFPVWISVLGAVGGLLFSAVIVLTVVPLSLLFSAAVVGVCFVGTGILLFFISALKLFAMPIVAVIPLGIGILMFGVGLLLVVLTCYLVFKAIPWMIRGILTGCNKCYQAIRRRVAR